MYLYLYFERVCGDAHEATGIKCIQLKCVFRAPSSLHVYANVAAFISIEMLMLFASATF